MASSLLEKFCPKNVPSQPVARLQLAQTQIEALTMALDVIRQPLQEFEQSLDRNQQARLAAALSAPSPSNGNASTSVSAACGVTATTVDRAIDELDQSLQPTAAQRSAMDATRHAFGTAANDLDAQCPTSLPATPLERLEATQARLDAEWRAILTIQVALATLESGLSDEQRVRFNALDLASR